MQRYEKLLQEFIERKIPSMLVGGTGIGKTDTLHKVAENMGRKLVMVHLARRSNTDFVIPKIEDDGTVSHSISKTFADAIAEGNTILFFDEYDRADGLTRGALLALINEREFEGYKLPDSVGIVAACNQGHSRDTYGLNQAELTRFAIIDLEIDTGREGWYTKEWMEWAQEAGVSQRILSFLSVNSDMLYRPTDDMKVFPSPRGWAKLSTMMPVIEDKANSRDIRMQVSSSIVGADAAGKFMTYLDVFHKLPSAEEILKRKPDWKSANDRLGVTDLLADHAKREPKHLSECIDYIDSKLGGEFSYVFLLNTKRDLYNEYMKFVNGKSLTAKKVKKILAQMKV